MQDELCKVVLAKICKRGRLLGLHYAIGRFLLKKMFWQDVGEDVLTCWYDVVACLVSLSWKICFKREIFEDSLKI
jgi:hypothetical protein